MAERSPFDLLLWVGEEEIQLWDRKRGPLEPLPYPASPQPVPGLPGSNLIWEDIDAQKGALRRHTGAGPLSRRRVLLAVPDDACWVERKALEELVQLACINRHGAGGLTLRPQGTLLRGPEETYIALGRSCRCAALSLVQAGAVLRTQYIPLYQAGREALETAVRTLGPYPVYAPASIPPALSGCTLLPLEAIAERVLGACFRM